MASRRSFFSFFSCRASGHGLSVGLWLAVPACSSATTAETPSPPGTDASTPDNDTGLPSDSDGASPLDNDASSPMAVGATTEAGCTETTTMVPLLPALHVAVGTTIQWNSNPPSSGSHYPIWAAFQEYSTPVPRGYYVHDLEHGAIVFLYNCGNTPCPDVVAALRAASDALPDDPLCTSAGEGVRVRTVITPDPLLDVPVAAAAWGYTYTAQCADIASLTAFATEHYGQGPEMFCTNGTTQF